MIENPNALEINAVEHCNLSCSGCSHLSPLMPRRVVDPDDVARDLAALAGCYRAGTVKVVGGEPLLHPDLPALLRAIRASGIAPGLRICTNGLLLHRLDPAIWPLIDVLEISLYPDLPYKRLPLAAIRDASRDHDAAVEINRYRSFRLPYAEDGTGDAVLTQAIFDTCQIAHHWRCHTVHEGRFYRCPQALFLPRQFPGIAVQSDSVALHEPGLAARLQTYLEREEALVACRQCLGTVGRSFPHRQAKRAGWREDQAGRVEQLVDRTRMAQLHRDIGDEEEGDTTVLDIADEGTWS